MKILKILAFSLLFILMQGCEGNYESANVYVYTSGSLSALKKFHGYEFLVGFK